MWFGENLDYDMMDGIENWLTEPVDLCIVIGTSGTVYPAAGYYCPLLVILSKHLFVLADGRE